MTGGVTGGGAGDEPEPASGEPLRGVLLGRIAGWVGLFGLALGALIGQPRWATEGLDDEDFVRILCAAGAVACALALRALPGASRARARPRFAALLVVLALACAAGLLRLVAMLGDEIVGGLSL